MSKKEPKVAIVHDWLVGYAGGDRVVDAMKRVFPDAVIYTLVYDPNNMPEHFKSYDIRTSWFQKVPFSNRLYKAMLPLMPRAFEAFDLTEYDLVLSSSSSWVLPHRKAGMVRYTGRPVPFPDSMEMERLENRELLFPLFSEEEQQALYAAYGLSLADRPEGLEPQAVSTGLMDILLPVRDMETLDRAVQNEAEVTRLSEHYDVVGVHMFCPNTPDAFAHCRNFAPLYAIPEEAATGTSNGALTYYLFRRGLIQAGADNRFVQGEKMGKPSEILSRITEDNGGVKVRVGGRALITLKCELMG